MSGDLPELAAWSSFDVIVGSAAGYAALALSSFAADLSSRSRLFGVGATAVVLLFVGIHNTWDNVAYHVLVSRRETDTQRKSRQ